MQITHDQAHTLIQLNIDRALSQQQKAVLFEHLQDCPECQIYAGEIKEVENILTPLMKRQWNVEPAPLSIEALLGVRSPKTNASHLVTTRIAALSVMVVALLFSVWQFMASTVTAYPPVPIGVPPIPTPSAQRPQSTSTTISFEECQMLIYTVQQSDTLAGIAARFSVPEAEIRAANQLTTATVGESMRLIIPLCKSTPTGTFDPLPTTFTPVCSPTTSTPGG